MVYHHLLTNKIRMSSVDQNMEFTDLLIRVGEKTFPVHKIVIASYSPVFRRMLQTEMMEKSTGEINIEDATPEVVQMMLEYIYNGNIDPSATDEKIGALSYLGYKYFMKDLTTACDYILANPKCKISNSYGSRKFKWSWM